MSIALSFCIIFFILSALKYATRRYMHKKRIYSSLLQFFCLRTDGIKLLKHCWFFCDGFFHRKQPPFPNAPIQYGEYAYEQVFALEARFDTLLIKFRKGVIE